MWFSADNLVLTLAQAACVALPAAGLPLWARRFRSGTWALVLPLNIAVVVVAIAVLPRSADVLTWIALLLVRLLAGAAPLSLLKAGVVAMAAVDAYLVFTNQLQAPSAVLNAAVPAAGLPRLQTGMFADARLGYGDFFAAAVVGGILAAERAPQTVAAAATLVVSLAWDQLFLVYDVLPATIPPAIRP